MFEFELVFVIIRLQLLDMCFLHFLFPGNVRSPMNKQVQCHQSQPDHDPDKPAFFPKWRQHCDIEFFDLRGPTVIRRKRSYLYPVVAG